MKAVTVPTLVAPVHDDTMTRPQDVQDIYDAIPVEEKSLYWIEGNSRRFDGYNFFGVHPELPIEWFDKHINIAGQIGSTPPSSKSSEGGGLHCRLETDPNSRLLEPATRFTF